MKIPMNFLKKIKIEGFNKRELTEQDGLQICEKEKITVLEVDVKRSFYFCCYGRHFIILKKGLRGLKKVFQLFHEIGHFYFHSGRNASNQAFFYGLIESKNEFEANVFATVAIVPITAIDSFEFLENHPRSRFARNLFNERKRLAFLYQF